MVVRTVLRALDDAAWSISEALGQRHAAYCHLETIDDDALVMSDGTRTSAFEVRGIKTGLDEVGFGELVFRLTQGIGSYLEDAGHALQILFEYDPAGALGQASRIYADAEATARVCGMEAAWLFQEWASTVARYTADERVLFVLFTRPFALSRAERKVAEERRTRAKRRMPAGQNGMRVEAVMTELRDHHRDFIGAVERALTENGVLIKPLTSVALTRELRRAVAPRQTPVDWEPWVPGDPLPLRCPDYDNPGWNPSLLLYPRLSEQVWPVSVERPDLYSVSLDGVRHSPVMMVLGPKYVTPFNKFLQRLRRERIPARLSWLVEGYGSGGIGLREFLSSAANWASETNKQLNAALEEVRRRHAHGVNQVRLRITADTWVEEEGAPDRAASQLRRQRGILLSLLHQWGQISASDMMGEALFGLAATLPACLVSAPGQPNLAPLADAATLWPLTRPASLWESGLLLNTPDGKLYPFGIGSSQQASWCHCTVAGLGAGKSVWENTMDLMFLLAPGLSRLPHLAIIDIGPSSQGLIDLLRALLPPGQSHLALYRRLRQRKEDAINPFDPPLGCDRPSPPQLEFLVNFVTLLATPDDRDAPEDGVEGVIRQSIRYAYDEYSRERRPKRFEPSVDEDISKALQEIDYEFDEETSWWEVVDALFGAGRIHQATLAQRYASPLLQDIGALALNPSVSEMYRIRRPNGETLSEYLHRVTVEAISRYPVLAHPTQLDLGEARIVALDLDEVAGRGSATADKQTGVMYMLARHAAAARFFQMPEHLSDAPPQYRDYHLSRIGEIRQDPKKLRYDEIHRIVRKHSVTQQVVADLQTAQRESRKWNLHIGMATQRMQDIPDALLSLLTSVFVLGVGDVEEAQTVGARLGLNSLLQDQLTALGKPGPRGANMIAQFRTAEGAITHVLTNTLSSSLVWAFSSTTEDVTIRTALYAKLGAYRALRVLAARYPGSAKPEIERRRQLRKDSGTNGSDVIQELISELAMQANELVARADSGL
jgi:intracellular multiplication protein IcmB